MPSTKVSSISERIKQGLVIRDMRQIDICAQTNIPRSALSQYVSGLFEPKQDRIYLISKALNVSEAWLMGYDVPMERQTPSIELSDEERKLLDLFRLVPEDKQQMLFQMIQVALGKI